MLAAFKGRILASAAGTLILEPADHDQDLVRAMELAKADGRRVIVRSGSLKPNAEDGIILNLISHHPAAVVSENTIEVVATETLGDLVTEMAAAGLSLPIDDSNKFRSVIGYVLGQGPAFPLSSPKPDLLINHVISIHAVYTDNPKQQRDLTGDEFRRAVATGPLPFIVTRLRFQSDGPCNDRWFHCWATVFDPDTARDLIKAMDGADALDGIDLTLRVESGALGLNLIVVRATGLGDDQHCSNILDFINAVLHRKRILKQVDSRGPQAIADWMSLSPVEKVPFLTISQVTSESPRALSDIAEPFIHAATFLIGKDPDGINATIGIEAWLMLRRSDKNAVDFDSQMLVNEITSSPDQVEEGRRLLDQIAGKSTRSVINQEFTNVTHKTSLLQPRPAGAGIIPKLKGDLFQPGTLGYAVKSRQYATSSYDAETIAMRMSPRMIVVPKDDADVVAVVEYAAAHSYHVVTRSGGHQYCGMSSGGNDTIQLSMDKFDSVSISEDGTVTVGAATPLLKLSSALLRANRTIPHGECPLVCVGGHLQTGGVGHLLRNLGLAIDYVTAFTIVTVGADRKATVRRLERPVNGGGDDAALFSAVLGGGPGSWGVLLQYELETVKDVPGTVGYSYEFLYETRLHDSKAMFRTVMYQWQDWTERLQQGQLDDGQDLFITFVSDQLLRPALVAVETAATTPLGAQQIRQVVDVVGAVQPPIPIFGKRIDGQTELSRIAHLGVRNLLVMAPRGREFLLPYKKSMRCSKKAFPKEFVDEFVDLVDRAHADPDTGVVVQVPVGGGKLAQQQRQPWNSMQRRQSAFMLVFDVFYSPSAPDGEQKAIAFQNEMTSLMKKYSDGQDERMFWGSFEDADRGELDIDMSQAQVQAYYYDTAQQYEAMQKVKRQVDPLNLFHTKFTVQL